MQLKALCLVATTSLLLVGCNQDNSSEPVKQVPQTDQEKSAYSVGVRMGEKIKEVSDEINGIRSDFDIDMYLQGISDQVHGTVQLSDEDVKTISHNFQKEYRELHRKQEAQKTQANLEMSQAFLKVNKSEEGVVETESGLQYKVLVEGDGESPSMTDKVSVLYEGRLIDGTVFDSTSKSNTPRTFAVNRVVKGWTEGLQLMKVGSKYEFYIPPELAYGSQARTSIPANSALIFQVELKEIIKPEVKKDEKKDEKKK